MKRILLAKRILFAVAALAIASGAMAQQFKWTDKDGKVQYGDTPPPGAKATRLKPPPGAPAPAAAAPDAKKDGAAAKDKPLSPEAAYRKRQQERKETEQKEAQDRAQAEARKQNCEQAQAALRQYQSGSRMATVTASGERAYLDDEQRAREAERAQKSVDEWCKG